jgi:hypothetical protein
MLKNKYYLLLPALALAVALSSCAHTKIISTWKDPGYQGHPKKILVYGMARSPDVRAIFENQLVEQFRERGLYSLASHQFIPDELVIDKEALKKVVKENEIDTIFIAHPSNRKDLQTLRPGEVSYSTAVYANSDDDFFMAVSGASYKPGTYSEEEVTMEMIIFDVITKKRVWSALSETYVGNTRDEEIAPAVKLIMKALVDSKIIP